MASSSVFRSDAPRTEERRDRRSPRTRAFAIRWRPDRRSDNLVRGRERARVARDASRDAERVVEVAGRARRVRSNSGRTFLLRAKRQSEATTFPVHVPASQPPARECARVTPPRAHFRSFSEHARQVTRPIARTCARRRPVLVSPILRMPKGSIASRARARWSPGDLKTLEMARKLKEDRVDAVPVRSSPLAPRPFPARLPSSNHDRRDSTSGSPPPSERLSKQNDPRPSS